MPEVDGIIVLYGEQPTAVDFDVHFIDEATKPNPFADISAKLAGRPIAIAIVNHREHAKGYRERDPELNKTLSFAVGAKIIGV